MNVVLKIQVVQVREIRVKNQCSTEGRNDLWCECIWFEKSESH